MFTVLIISKILHATFINYACILAFSEAMDIPMTVAQYKETVDHHLKELFPHAQFLPGTQNLSSNYSQVLVNNCKE